MQGTNIHFRMPNFVQPNRALSNKSVAGGGINTSLTTLDNALLQIQTNVHTRNTNMIYPSNTNTNTTTTTTNTTTNNIVINSSKNIEPVGRIIVNDEYDTPQGSDASSDELSDPPRSSKTIRNVMYDSDDDDDIVKPDFEYDDDADKYTYIQKPYK